MVPLRPFRPSAGVRWVFRSRAPAATVLIRLAVGGVFLAEGVQKFLYSSALGAGRFAKIGIPAPEWTAPLVGSFEMGCGTLILMGLFTRLAAVPLLVVISVAILSTKIPVLLGYGYWGFADPSVSATGIWSMLHEARTDLAMWLSLAFLLIVGAGSFSLDRTLLRRWMARGIAGRR